MAVFLRCIARAHTHPGNKPKTETEVTCANVSWVEGRPQSHSSPSSPSPNLVNSNLPPTTNPSLHSLSSSRVSPYEENTRVQGIFFKTAYPSVPRENEIYLHTAIVPGVSKGLDMGRQLREVEIQLEAGANPNIKVKGYTALGRVCQFENWNAYHKGLVLLLVGFGARVDDETHELLKKRAGDDFAQRVKEKAESYSLSKQEEISS